MMKTALSLLLAFAIGACSSSPAPDGEAAPAPAGDGLTFVIDNSRGGASSLTVYVVPDPVGSRVRLGDIRLGEKKTLTSTRTIASTRLRLVGVETGGRERVSEAFTVTRQTVVEWDVARNRIFLSGVPETVDGS